MNQNIAIVYENNSDFSSVFLMFCNEYTIFVVEMLSK